MFLHIVLSLTMNNVRGFLIICNFIYFREAYHQVDSYNSALFKQITSLSNNNEEKRNNLLKLLTGISCSADAAQMDMRDFGMSEGWVSISSNEWKDWSAKQKLLILLWVYDRAIMLFLGFFPLWFRLKHARIWNAIKNNSSLYKILKICHVSTHPVSQLFHLSKVILWFYISLLLDIWRRMAHSIKS